MPKIIAIFSLVIASVLLPSGIFGQSSRQDFPSPILTNEISGRIPARDVGDSRLTDYFYTFYANNGDLTLTVETENFNGDVDLFTAQTFRPLTKISIFAGNSLDSTTKTVYFRKREQVVLRIEGRTPGDDSAKFKISFSGSFEAGNDLPQPPANLLPKIAEAKIDEEKGGVRVNSVGSIVEVIPPKPKPTPVKTETKPVEKTASAKTAPKPKTTSTAKTNPKSTKPSARKTTPETIKPENNETAKNVGNDENPETTKPEGNETASVVSAAKTTPKSAKNPTNSSKPNPTKPKSSPKPKTPKTANEVAKNDGNSAEKPTAKSTNKTSAKTAKPKNPEPSAFDPNTLANIRLVILLKDGTKIERPMSEVFRVTVDKGDLTVITKNGKIEHYSLLDVQKFSIEQ